MRWETEFIGGLILATVCAIVFFGLTPFQQFDACARIIEVIGFVLGFALMCKGAIG